MQDDTPRPAATVPPSSRLVREAKRLERTKVTPLIVILFIGALALLSFAAAGIGYVAHHLRH